MHSVEQQEADEEDESEAGDDHSAQRETVAAFTLNDLGANNKVKLQRIKHFPPFSKTWIRLTEPTRTCITISPIPALVTRTDVAHPADTRVLLQLLQLNGCKIFHRCRRTLVIEDVFSVGQHAGEDAAEEQPA